jgi:hypothetical protein
MRSTEPRGELGTKTTSTILAQYLLGRHDFASQFSRIRAQLIDGCLFFSLIIAYGQGGSSNRDEKIDFILSTSSHNRGPRVLDQ